MTASPSVRGLRAAVFAALCVLLAAGGHALATGAAPPVWVQASGFVPVFGAGYLLGARERSLAAIGAGTLLAQGGLHLAFDAVRPHSMMLMQGMYGMHAMSMGHSHALTPHATAAHVGAAVVLTWWLRRGEAALWSLLRRTATLVPGLAAWWQVRGGAWGVPAAPDAVRPCADGPRPLRRLLLRHAVQRRGPPPGMSYAI
ncbi:hypothetical protein GCM10022403_018650 [Streptomyces coacervatus]|uniref:Integral membrane protein n=1 Tax=Streptomyces coacervatus TaxID=647381 RepID=A0ABP7H6H2_9ACTN|nr:hypothetical protein [Streptomyces coacervatus]MDF2267345.1 hypothetical protein [Streptomyces coacervatus]